MDGTRSIYSLNDIMDVFKNKYSGIFQIDLENDRIEILHISEKLLNRFRDQGMSMHYSKFFSEFITSVVVLEEQTAVWKALDIEFLAQYLTEHKEAVLYMNCLIDGEIISVKMEFVNRESDNSLQNVVLLIERNDQPDLAGRFYRKPTKILVVEDDEIQQSMLKDFLEDEGYVVITAGDGFKALDILKGNHKDIACVITDYVMPGCDGYELILKMRAVNEYMQIPVIVMTGEGGAGTEFKFLRIGATDFIYKPYDFDILYNRIRSILEMEEKHRGLKDEYYDPLTGLLRRNYFCYYAERFIREHPENEYCIVVSDIENFKNVNERYGDEFGDEVLSKMASMGADMIPGYIIGGRIYKDIFTALVKVEENWLNRYMENSEGDYKPPVSNLKVKVGVVQYDGTMGVQKLCDCAQIAAASIKGNVDVNFAMYDDKIKDKLQEEQNILNSMYDALEKAEFQLYFQPKYSVKDEIIAGAEALVRWIHPELGFMNPGKFVPLFEKNGFIKKMDWYIFEELCKTMREWQREDRKLVPVSVNMSRRDFESTDFAKRFIDLVDEYGIDHSLIHVEVTESAYTDNPDNIISSVRTFHDAGFVIELDDFGTGYTSLTTLNSMKFDILKLDISLVRAYRPDSDRNTLNYAIHLARLLNLKTVAEGVETKEQRKWMDDLGVDYIQGYYYSKPLSKKEFEAYALNI